MSAELQRRVLDLFEQAAESSESEREALLAAADPETAARVRALLRSDTAARRAWPTEPPEPLSSSTDPDPPRPERIGPWRLTRLLGRGGMGSVWLGERADGLFEQQVAIKLIRPGLFSAAAAAQFATERRLLARLRHPNIARLYDGGVDGDGRSYIVMEVVDGLPITDFADRKSLPLKARLQLFALVCDAVQHAHQSLVVHADIKPGNVLVEADGAPKLLDFGIARGLTDADADRAHGLTTVYASPQRRAGERSVPGDDVYALGVLLADLAGGGGHEASEPSAAAVPDMDVRPLAAKAAADDPAERYAGAAALAEDVRRKLEGRPVAARPATPARAFALFTGRHPRASAAATLAVVGLLSALAVIGTLYVRAENQRAQAEERFTQVRSLARYMLFDFADRLQTVPGGSEMRRDAADVGRRYLQQLSAAPGAPDDLRLETAIGYSRVGHALALASVPSTGDVAAGERALVTAEAALRRLHAEHPDRAEVAVELARVLTVRGAVTASTHGDVSGGLRMTREAIRLFDGVLARDPRRPDAGYGRWNAAVGEADLLATEDRHAEIIAVMRQARRRGDVLPRTGAEGVTRALIEAGAANHVGNALYALNDRAGALAEYRRGWDALERVRAAAAGPVDVRLLDRQVHAAWNVSSSLSEEGRLVESLEWADRGAAAASLLGAFDHSRRSRQVGAMIALQRSQVLSLMGRHDDAVASARTVVSSRRAWAAAAPQDIDLQQSAAASLRPLAEVYNAAGRRAEACETARASRDAWARLERVGALTPFFRRSDLAVTLQLLQGCGSG